MPTIKKQTATMKPKAVVTQQDGWPDDDQGIHILLYGKSGTGKTTLWGDFPGPITVAICSGGVKSGELRSIDTPEHRRKIKPRRLTSSDQMREIIETADAEGVATLVLDHVSGLQDLTLKEILGLDELPAQKSWGMATQQQYGQSTLMCKEILRAMLNLNCNVVIIGQERQDEPAGGEGSELMLAPTVGVATTPSLAGWLNPAVDYICQTFKRPVLIEREQKIGEGPKAKTVKTVTRGKGVEYCLRTAPHDVYTTKFRKPKGVELPELIVDPTYAKLMAVIRGEKLAP